MLKTYHQVIFDSKHNQKDPGFHLKNKHTRTFDNHKSLQRGGERGEGRGERGGVVILVDAHHGFANATRTSLFQPKIMLRKVIEYHPYTLWPMTI
jgi:hypothetical protein